MENKKAQNTEKTEAKVVAWNHNGNPHLGKALGWDVLVERNLVFV